MGVETRPVPRSQSEVQQLTDASAGERWMGGQGESAAELISIPDKEEEPHLTECGRGLGPSA